MKKVRLDKVAYEGVLWILQKVEPANKEYMDMWCIAVNTGHLKMNEVTHRLVFAIPVIVEYLSMID